MNSQNEETIIDIPSSRRSSFQDQPTTDSRRTQQDTRQGKMMAAPKTKEYVKMIRLILSKLTKRKRPPPPVTCFIHYSQTDNTSALVWDHDETIDLVIKLRSVLLICENTGLHILDQRGRQAYTSPAASRSSSPSRPESSVHPTSTTAPATTHSTNAYTKKDQQPTEFDAILQLTSELITNDCRYAATHPKPSRPPLTLQTMVLDITVLMIQACDDIPALYKIGTCMLPAFETFPESTLKVKLLSVFIDILLPKLMQTPHNNKNDDRTERSVKLGNESGIQKSNHSGITPIINVQSPEEQETKMDSTNDATTSTNTNKFNHLTIDTKAVPSASSLLSPATHQSSDNQLACLVEPIQQYALFIPLLTFMIQYLDPYLDPQQSVMEDMPARFPGKSYSIFNFHKALRFMIQHKPDLHLDILKIIAYSLDDVKFRACQVLFHYYFVSLGHIVVAEALPKLGVTLEIGAINKQQLAQQQQQQQQRHQQSLTSVFANGYQDTSTNDMAATAGTVYNTGINRKYGSNNSPGTPLRSNSGTTDLEDDPTEELSNIHVWYPHMFVSNTSKTQQQKSAATDSVSDMMQQFQPSTQSVLALVNDDINGSYCNGCYKQITGFGLRCYQCKHSVHYQCYNYCLANDDLDIMLYVKEGGIQKVVSPQFCHVPVQPRYADIAAGHEYQWDKSNRSPKVHLLGHQFHLVNLYTLMLCACCRTPLWGISQQGYRCSICNRFVHPACLDQSEHEGSFSHPLSTIQDCQPYRPLLESDTRITSSELLESMGQFYGDMIPSVASDLNGRSYEEVGTMVNVLVLQDNILRYGISAGCLLVDYVSSSGDGNEVNGQLENGPEATYSDPLLHAGTAPHKSSHRPYSQEHAASTTSKSTNAAESGTSDLENSMCPKIRRSIELCLQHIKSSDCPASSFLEDFKNEREWSQTAYECLLSREDYLAHVGAMMKSLASSVDRNAPGAGGSMTDHLSPTRSSANDNNSNSSNNNDLLQVSPSYFNSKQRTLSRDSDSAVNSMARSDIYGQPSTKNVLDRDTLLSWAMDNLYIKSRKVGEILLQHMRNLGLFERYDASPILFSVDRWTTMDKSTHDCQTQCIFPVPYAIDCSPHVETLISAVESCLNDIDIAINECGLLLLTRRCWPDPFMSEYTRERLLVAILRWILLEDEKLTALYAAFTLSNGIQLPGVKQNRWAQTAQSALLSRMKGGGGADREYPPTAYGRQSSSNTLYGDRTKVHSPLVGTSGRSSTDGGSTGFGNKRQNNYLFGAGVSSGAGNVYVTTRNALRDRYLNPWMATLHDIDPTEYATILNSAIDEVVESIMDDASLSELGHASTHQDKKASTLQHFDIFMGYLVKLKSLGLTFSGLNSIIELQLDKACHDFETLNILKERTPVEVKALTKLFSTKVSSAKSYGTHAPIGDSTSPFDIILDMLLEQDGKLADRGIQWLSLIVHLGTGIPAVSLAKIARSLVEAQASISTTAEFIKLVWFQVVNGLNVVTSHAVIIDIIGYLNETALESLKSKNESEPLTAKRLLSAQTFIRYSAALTCYAYNCPLSNISDLDIVPYFTDQISHSHSKQSLHIDRTPPMQVDDNTPIIRCMLLYLQLDQINVREVVVKMFYALINWGAGIGNKSEFISKCIPSLIPTVWELLPPSHDDISDINLNLLMKLMNTDALAFHACVYKIMEDTNWEIRYQGLDSLHGLFTKMDVAFQTKWLSLLSHLGPVFSTFISCIWDKEENVRSKALALIRTIGMLHLRSAFRCWEAYFLTATDRQRRPLVNLMIQLNSMFPDWQVLQWESLLEALEAKLPNSSASRDILDDYARPSMDMTLLSATTVIDNGKEKQQQGDRKTKKNIPAGRKQKSALKSTGDGDHSTLEGDVDDGGDLQEKMESRNTKVLMMTLALQMLSNHLSIDLVQISRLKLLLVVHMGFENCQRYNVSGEWIVDFGILHVQPDDPVASAMLTCCTRGLKKVMDSFSPLPAETVATMAPDVLERNKLKLAENSSPGVHFIDVALKLFNSGVDLTAMNNIIIKSWLEIILIVVYKHNILDRNYEHSIVGCMKQIIDLITKEIGEENKLVILEILKCLLRQSDHLTAMVLSKQILALGKLMTKCGKRTSEPVFLKAKQFLKCAFLRFAVAGLFVLIFKNQTVSNANSDEVDLFYVLRTVIVPEDIVPDEDQNHVVYLLDQPVRDVLDKLLKQQMDRKSFSTVLHNMSRYVETVHSHPYPESVLNDYADFLNLVVKYTADWRRSDWNINSLFTMSSLLLLEHPYHFQILLPSMQVLFRHGIRHCSVTPECVVNLMASYSTIATIPGTPPENVFVETILEEIRTGLTIKQKLHKDTLLILLQLVYWDCADEYRQWYTSIENTYIGELPAGRRRQPYFATKLGDLLEPLVNFLKSSSNADQFTKKDFKAYNTVSHILLWMCNKNKENLYQIMHMLKLDETSHCLQFLNWIILCMLKNQSDSLLEIMDDAQDVMTELLVQIFSSIQINFDQPDPGFSYSASGEALVLCFLILKTWTLLNLRTLHTTTLHGLNIKNNKPSFWVTVWPSISRLLCAIDPSTLNMAGNVGLSIWNMFLSLLQFLHMCRSEAVMANAFDWCNILDYLIYQLSDMETNLKSIGNDQQKNVDGGFQDDDMDYNLVPLAELKIQAERVRRMFNIPPIEVPAITLIDYLYLELKDIMRLQSATSNYQDHWNTAAVSTSSGFSF